MPLRIEKSLWWYLLFGITCYFIAYFIATSYPKLITEAELAVKIENDINNRKSYIDKHLNNWTEALLHNESIPDSLLTYGNESIFNLYVFEGEQPIKWTNSDLIVYPNNQHSGNWQNYQNKSYIGLVKQWDIDSTYHIVAYIPLGFNNPNVVLSNTNIIYVESNRLTGFSITADALSGGHLVNDQHQLYLLKTHTQVDVDNTIISVFALWIIACALFSIPFLLRMGSKRSSVSVQSGFLIFFLLQVLGVIAIYKFGPPLRLEQTSLFSPTLYANGLIIPSIGHLIHILFAASFSLIYLINNKVIVYENKSYNTRFKYSIAALLYAIIPITSFITIGLIKSLILNSQISFDLIASYIWDIPFMMACFIISLILLCYFTLSSFVKELSQLILLSSKTRTTLFLTIFIIIIGLLYTVPYSNDVLVTPVERLLYPITTLVLFSLVKPKDFKLQLINFFGKRILLWALILSFLSAFCIHYYDSSKIIEIRQAFAQRIVRGIDYQKTKEKISIDSVFNNNSLLSQTVQKKDWNAVIELVENILNSYDITSSEIGSIELYADTLIANKIFTKEETFGQLPFDIYGINILIRLTKQYEQLQINNYLKKSKILDNYENKINYAIYYKHQLVANNHVIEFPAVVENTKRSFFKENHNDKSGGYIQWFPINENYTIAIALSESNLFTIFSLFCFEFMMLTSIVVIYTIFNLLIKIITNPRSRYFNLSMRASIHISTVAIIIITLFTVGFVTIQFLIGSSKKEYYQRYIERLTYYKATYESNYELQKSSWNIFTDSSIVKYNRISNIDINVFDTNGNLVIASRPYIVSDNIKAPIIQWNAFAHLILKNEHYAYFNDYIGSQIVNGGYAAIENTQGNPIAILHVPFIESPKAINLQISKIVINLINISTIIFILSIIISGIISVGITKALDGIIRKLGFVSSASNMRLEETGNIEIDRLVEAYNNMAEQIEDKTIKLIDSERQLAWRTMAQQVAHEIKNPLTPMKLNIQYLQKAAINNAPNLAPLALKISDGIIEQIDNLTNITTAFSNFAKLPENKPQDYCMNDLVANCVQLFNVQENITLDLQLASEKLYCHIDKDLFTQVMNNLVLNAIQSIEKDKNGFIQIMLSKNSSDALLEIKDNGVGIPTALHDKMFSPYITTKATGTGLGLAMTKQIIEQWNGKIGFDSVEGVGSTFYIRLPLIHA